MTPPTPALAPQGRGAISGSREPGLASRPGPPGFDPARIGRWFSIENDGPPQPEVFVLCWDGRQTFVDWCGSRADFGRGVTHWQPYELPPACENDMHDGRRAFAASGTSGSAQDAQPLDRIAFAKEK